MLRVSWCAKRQRWPRITSPGSPFTISCRRRESPGSPASIRGRWCGTSGCTVSNVVSSSPAQVQTRPGEPRSSPRCLNKTWSVRYPALRLSFCQVTHAQPNAGTVEGVRHRTLPAFSVQFHPEGRPGPTDAEFLYDRFLELVREHVRA